MRLRGPLPLALAPLFLIAFLAWNAGQEDTYTDDGSSYWETHPSGRVALVVAVMTNLGAVLTMFIVRGTGRAGWAIATVAMAIGVFATLFALIAISAN